jgi:hypothetical protein
MGLQDKGITGNFEVTVASTKQLLHSKRHAGQGKASTEQERKLILEQIKELLEEDRTLEPTETSDA